jgi:hypothetical protein
MAPPPSSILHPPCIAGISRMLNASLPSAMRSRCGGVANRNRGYGATGPVLWGHRRVQTPC